MYTTSNQGIYNYPQTAYPQLQNNYNYQYPNVSRPNLVNAYNTQTSLNPNQPSSIETSTPVENGLLGRIVDKTEEIMPSEIRMDGSLGFFPMRDLSAIYVKQWDQNANLQTVRYIPEVVIQQSKEETIDQSQVLSQILDQLGDIQNLLKKNDKPRYNNKKSNYKKNNKYNHYNENHKEIEDVQNA